MLLPSVHICSQLQEHSLQLEGKDWALGLAVHLTALEFLHCSRQTGIFLHSFLNLFKFSLQSLDPILGIFLYLLNFKPEFADLYTFFFGVCINAVLRIIKILENNE